MQRTRYQVGTIGPGLPILALGFLAARALAVG